MKRGIKLNELPMQIRKKIINENKITISASNLEQNACNAPLGKKKAARFNSLVSLHVHSIRKRLADPDGISAKAVIDGLIKAGILSDDSAKEIAQITYSQEKGEQEETIINILET